MELEYPTAVEEKFMRSQYADRKALCEAYVEKKKAARSAKGTPQEYKANLEEEIATLRYHMSFLLEKFDILNCMIGPMEEMYNRMSLLEGAYSHLKLVAQNTVGQKNP